MRITGLVVLSAMLSMTPLAVHAQGKPAPKDAVLYFVWPQDKAVIKGAFWCRFGLRNMGVTHAGDNFQNSGHHHLLIDVNDPLDPKEPIPQDKSHLHFGAGQTEARIELPPRQTYAPTRARRRRSLSLQPATRLEQDYRDDQVSMRPTRDAQPALPERQKKARLRGPFEFISLDRL